ncbi:trigger factor [Castellaniella sp.]|uniref:trigger factor n=1 Tax=Castellaniella sp. TaxID=1955812 RepID=UPI003563D409
MQPVVEKLSGLERRVDLTVLVADVEKEVQAQLKRIARTAKVQGFRPGKAPLSIIERSHGPSVRYEVINTQIGKSLDKVIEEADLRLAGAPVLEPKVEGVEDGVMAFSATFEVYPEVAIPDLGALEVVRSTVEIGDAEVDKTVAILRQQRTVFRPVEGRVAQDGDRVTLDFAGTIDSVAFEGGTAEDFPFVLGQGRMLPEFELAVQGMQAGDEKTFPLKFPDDYGSPDVAGKEAEFTIKVKEVAEPELPELDADFARALGQAEGDVEALMLEIRGNVEREARARARNRTKASVMDALAAACAFDLPKALVDSELQERIKAMREELTQRGLPNADTIDLPEDQLRPEAERRVRLGLLVGELIRQAELKARPEQVRARIEEFAQSYEQPAQVVAYYLSDKQRRAEIESFVLEDNVVDHVLGVAKVTDEAVDFDTLMGTR